MSAPSDMIERSAMAIFRVFVAGAIGTCRQKRDRDGHLMWTVDHRGQRVPLAETPDEAAARRWRDASEMTRSRFRKEAEAALEAA